MLRLEYYRFFLLILF